MTTASKKKQIEVDGRAVGARRAMGRDQIIPTSPTFFHRVITAFTTTLLLRHYGVIPALLICYFYVITAFSCFNTFGLLTKCEVKMAGYWPSSFFACLWTETKSMSINSQKENEANIQPS